MLQLSHSLLMAPFPRVRFGQDPSSNPVNPAVATEAAPAATPAALPAAPLTTTGEAPLPAAAQAPAQDPVQDLFQLVAAAVQEVSASLTPQEAKQLLSEGRISNFNDRLKAWRKANPNEYFDLKGFKFGEILGALEGLQAINPDVECENTLDLRSCDLRGADFRGLKQLTALFSQGEYDADDPAPVEKHIKTALTDSTTRFSPSTIKIFT